VIGRVKVEMRRSGGFAGRTTKVHLDTADMPPAEAARLIQLVTTVDLSRLNVARGAPSAGADLMRYDLVIENGVDRWEGTVSDPSIPNELRPLLQFLTAAAR
jgi:emfourin